MTTPRIGYEHGGRDAVREQAMVRLRAGIRERQAHGLSDRAIRGWIDKQEAHGAITEEEGALARLIARHYTHEAATYLAGFTRAPIGA